MFQDLRRGGYLSEKQLSYDSFKYKKAFNLGKLYLLPKIHKRLYNVPGRPVISNCETPTEKASEFLDNHLKPIMQNSWSYIRDSGDFIDKIKRIKNIPKDAILVTAYVVRLYPCIPHVAGLKALKNALDATENKSIPTENILKMAELVLKNNNFEFNGTVKQQISGTAIGTKCAPKCSYAYIFMSEFKTRFIESQQNKPLVWFRYIDDIFFIWTHGENKSKTFLEHHDSFDPSLKFTRESRKESLPFLDLKVKLAKGKISTDLYVKDTDRHQYLHYTSSHPNHTK